MVYRSSRNGSVLSEGDTETHGNEEEDHILDADLQEEEDSIKRVRQSICVNAQQRMLHVITAGKLDTMKELAEATVHSVVEECVYIQEQDGELLEYTDNTEDGPQEQGFRWAGRITAGQRCLPNCTSGNRTVRAFTS